MKTIYIATIKLTFLLLFVSRFLMADDIPNGKISGMVKTVDGQVAPYVNITLVGLNKATHTREDGTYILNNLKPGIYTLKVSFVGMKTEEKEITVQSSKTTIANFTLNESAAELSEVSIKANRKLINKPVSLDKSGLRPLDLPQSSGIVNAQMIADQQVNHLADAVKNVSGVSLTQTRGGVGETFSARGYSIGIGGAAGSIFKNGVLI